MDVTLQWNANTEPDLCGYMVYYDTDSPGDPYENVYVVPLEELIDADNPEYTLTGLDPEKYYYFAVAAYDSEEFRSDYSDEVNTVPPVYFPYVISGDEWETEICVINTSDSLTIKGSFRAYSDTGSRVSEVIDFSIVPNGRREITVGDEFIDHGSIDYIVFETNSDAIVGYTKLFIEGHYRVAMPAVPESDVNDGNMYISHIASHGEGEAWYTGVSFLNTTSSGKNLTIEFNNGQKKEISLEAKEQRSFAIRNLFDSGQPQPDITSAVVTNTWGVIGLEFFINNVRHWLSSIMLKDDTANRIYYPHIAVEDGWTTGIVAYNHFDDLCDITVIPYDETGSVLLPVHYDTIGVREKHIGVISDFGLAESTAWFEIEASHPINGIQLFAKKNQMAGFAGFGESETEGVFPKLERDGWTGIVLVNVTQHPADVTVTAYNDNGIAVASTNITLNA